MRIAILAVAVSAVCLAFTAQADIPALTPCPRNKGDAAWWKTLEETDELVKKGGSKVVFLGDDFFYRWSRHYWRDWENHFGLEPYGALNLGFAEDRTENVLWRIGHGQLDGYEAKIVVLMVGACNSEARDAAHETTIDTIVGVKAVLDAVRAKQPKARIVLCGILPRGARPDDPLRVRSQAVNKEIRKFADDRTVFWCDFGDRLLTRDGRLLHEVSPDLVHPTEIGCRIAAEALRPFVNDALNAKPGELPRVTSCGADRIDEQVFSDEPAVPLIPSSNRIMTRGYSSKYGWYEKRLAEKANERSASDAFDLVFLGDSIVQGWDDGPGIPVLRRLSKTYRILTLGYGGDSTDHVLWRIQHGELDGYKAKLIMLLIGTNNAWRGDLTSDVRDGVAKILSIIREKHPESKILLMSPFPRDEEWTGYGRMHCKMISEAIRPLALGDDNIRWLDIGRRLMRHDGTISRKMMKDLLHPGTEGYEIWAEEATPYFEWACGRGPAPENSPAARIPLVPPEFSTWRDLTPSQIVTWVGNPNSFDVVIDPEEPWTRMKTSEFLPCIDRYGQFKWRDWPGKVTSDDDLAAAKAAEEKELAAWPGPSDRDEFGGWTKGPQLKATGRFRAEKVDGRWWLVDPLGRLFWSAGVTRVSSSCAVTPLNGNGFPDRDALFEDLPAKGTPLAKFYETYNEMLHPFYLMKNETRTYDFSSANLFRKYGADYLAVWRDLAHRRLRSWGFNTLGNSTDLAVALMDRTPYAERIEAHSRPIEGSEGLWTKFRDPFDPSFTNGVTKALVAHGREAHDKWCIGFFVDNELMWGTNDTQLAEWTLASPDDQPAKAEFLRRLEAKYGHPVAAKDVTADDLRAFTTVLVEEYFRRTRDTLKAYDPGLLYLGCRFMGATTPEIAAIVAIAAKYCDVMSYNIYLRDPTDFCNPGGVDKPVIGGEYHFGALDRGLFTGGCRDAEDQKDRGERLIQYLKGALANPFIVGVHWHQFSDEPASGRFDGENMQIGITDICDRPYAETVEAARSVTYGLYDFRTNGGKEGK